MWYVEIGKAILVVLYQLGDKKVIVDPTWDQVCCVCLLVRPFVVGRCDGQEKNVGM